MDVALRTETTLAAALNRAKAEPAPAGLARALDHSVFLGGARVRPPLCLSVAQACDETGSATLLANAAAASLELIHCARRSMTICHASMMRTPAAGARRSMPPSASRSRCWPATR
jgi:geranylgeranyl diphosphate synthase type II